MSWPRTLTMKKAIVEQSGLMQHADVRVAAYMDDDGRGEFCLVEAEMTVARTRRGEVSLRYDSVTGELIGVIVPPSLLRLPVTALPLPDWLTEE